MYRVFLDQLIHNDFENVTVQGLAKDCHSERSEESRSFGFQPQDDGLLSNPERLLENSLICDVGFYILIITQNKIHYVYDLMDSLIIQLLILVAASYILVRAASRLVTSISIIGGYFKLSEFVVAFVLMGVVTSLPEIAVAITSAINNNPVLALGTAIGSNLTNLTLIIGIPVLIGGGLEVRSIIARKDAVFMAIFAVIPLILLIDGTIGAIDGVILLLFYALYLYRLFTQRSHFSQFTNHFTKKNALAQIGVFIFYIAILFAASYVIVIISEMIATNLEIPVILIGLIILSVGTSLPELAHGLISVKTKHSGQILGDILGSVVANSTLIIALAAIIKPIVIVNLQPLILPSAFLILTLVLFLIFVYSGKRLEIKEALFLMTVYFLYIITELGLQIVSKTGG